MRSAWSKSEVLVSLLASILFPSSPLLWHVPDVVAAAVVVSFLAFTNKLKAMDPQSPMRINGNGMSTIIISKYCHLLSCKSTSRHACNAKPIRN